MTMYSPTPRPSVGNPAAATHLRRIRLLLIVIMGVVIGGMIIALYMPMFSVINLIK